MAVTDLVDERLLEEIVRQPRSITKATIVEELVDASELDEHEARRVIFEALKEGTIEEHPEFNGTYVLVGTQDP